MKYQRVTANFIRYKENELLSQAGGIVQRMKDSAVFPHPKPSIKKLEAALLDYRMKVQAAMGGGKIYVEAKKESKANLAKLLQQLAFYVNSVADGNLVKLYSSGFPVLAHKRKGSSPDTPSMLYIKDGNRSGEVYLGFKPVGRDMLYEYVLATGTDKKGRPLWGEVKTTTRSFRNYETGFTPGVDLYFRVRARNKHGVSNWSDTISLMVR